MSTAGLDSLISPLRVCRLRIVLRARSAVDLPAFKGYVLRGAIGYALRDLVCPDHDVARQDCAAGERCLFSALFPPEGGGYRPSAFALQPPLDRRRHYDIDDELPFELSLFGHTTDAAPIVVAAVRAAAETGLGKTLGTFTVDRVQQLAPSGPLPFVAAEAGSGPEDSAYQGKGYLEATRPTEPVHRLRLTFLTPTSLKHGEQAAQNIPFALVVNRLVDRVALLLKVFQGIEPAVHRRSLTADAHAVSLERSSLRWVQVARTSARSGQRIPLKGLVGSLDYEGELTPWLALLQFGTYLQVGNKTSHGFGSYHVEVLD